MHYDPKLNNHGMTHSYFDAVYGRPPFVMFSSSEPKHTQRNTEATGEFVAGLSTEAPAREMNATSATFEAEISEPEAVGIEMAPSRVVTPPRVSRSPTALECRYVRTIPITGADGTEYPGAITIGEVVSIYIGDDIIVDERLGYMDYATLGDIFEMKRPK